MEKTANYEALFQCFLSEQMTPAQLEHHMRDDEVFRSWVSRRMRERRRG